MYNVRANVMVDVVNPSIVPINCCKSSAKITPFLSAVPGEFLLVSVVMQVCNEIQPHDKNYIWNTVELKHWGGTKDKAGISEEKKHQTPTYGGSEDGRAFIWGKQVAVGIEVRTFFAWTSRPQICRVCEQRERHSKSHNPGHQIQAIIDLLRQRNPGFVLVDISMVLVVSPVADSPSMVRNQNRRMQEVPHHIV